MQLESLTVLSPYCFPAYTYFYKGTKYWKFDNERLKTEPGYPKSILRDFMGCHEEVAMTPDPGHRWPSLGRPTIGPGGAEEEYNVDAHPEEEDNEVDVEDTYSDNADGGRAKDRGDNDVDIVVHIDEYPLTLSIVMVMVPLVLLLGILGLVYALVQLQRKGTPRMLLYCKRSLQEWV